MTIELSQLLLLIIIANGAPVVIQYFLKNHFEVAIDFGVQLPDHQPLFGSSKTIRGVLAALLLSSALAVPLGLSPATGFQVALYALCGDLISSFIKRRLRMPASSMAPLLDQIPESLFPALMMMKTFGLDFGAVIQLVLIFILLELSLSWVLYRFGIRKRPY